MSKEYITLPRVGGIKVRKKYYVSEVFEEHPAKADIPMMIWILKKFCKDGDIVLDPMAGIGTTLVEGMRMFPKSVFIGVELEEKFVRLANKSVVKTEDVIVENWFTKMGKAVCIQGDARDLERVMKMKCDRVVMSPPYSETRMDGGSYRMRRKTGMRPYTDEAPDTWRTQRDQRNIGNLGHGKIDKVVLSPPYARTVSPFTGGAPMPEDKGTHIGCRNIRTGYGKGKENIGNLPLGKVDKVITSPPYEDQMGRFKRKDKSQVMKDKKLYTYPDECEKTIGTLKGKTYLEAMFLVYLQCFEVLKPGGLMVLITKDFIKNYKRVHLGMDTIRLCVEVGFEHAGTYHRKITNPSFWRNDYYKKHPEVEKIDCEDILCFRKENEN